MRIGIISVVDINTFLPFFEKEEDKMLLKNNHYPNATPAVNTLILSLLQEGHFIRIFTKSKTPFILCSSHLEIYGINLCQQYPAKYLWGIFLNANSLKKVLKTNINDLDILHAHWTYEFAYAASFYTRQLPVLCTVRDWAPYIWKIESFKNKITWCFKYIMNELVLKNEQIHFIANSPYTANLIKQKYGKQVPIIPNPIKSSFIKKKDHIYPSKIKILCISTSNDKRKNIISLLRAFSLFKVKFPHAILQLIGPPFVAENPKIIKWKKSNLLQQVELVGVVAHDKLIEYIDQATLFITPSLEETFGNTLLENIVRKVPVIGGEKSGAIPYVLHGGKAGFLCDVSDPKSINETLEYVCLHPKEVKIITENAFDIILSEYKDSIICQQHIALYNQYINKKTKNSI